MQLYHYSLVDDPGSLSKRHFCSFFTSILLSTIWDSSSTVNLFSLVFCSIVLFSILLVSKFCTAAASRRSAYSQELGIPRIIVARTPKVAPREELPACMNCALPTNNNVHVFQAAILNTLADFLGDEKPHDAYECTHPPGGADENELLHLEWLDEKRGG